MVDTLDILKSLSEAFKRCMPETRQYIGSMPDNIEMPCFLHLLVFNGDSKESYFIKETVVEVQSIYFSSQLGERSEEKLYAIKALKAFLSEFNLKVKERNLKLTYNFTEADGKLAINTVFRFKDELVNTKYEEEQTRDIIQNVYMNTKGVI